MSEYLTVNTQPPITDAPAAAGAPTQADHNGLVGRVNSILAALRANTIIAAGSGGVGKLNFGINLAAGSIGEHNGLTTYGQNYYYPRISEMDYVASQGAKTARITFMSYRVYDPATGQLKPDASYLQTAIGQALTRFDNVIVEAHDYGRWIPYTDDLTAATMPAYIDMMVKLLGAHKTNPKLIPSFMNEPTRLGANVVPFNKTFITGLRNAGFTGEILVVGVQGYSPLRGYNEAGGSTGGQVAFDELIAHDPLHNLVGDGHIYFDDTSEGKSPYQVMDFVDVASITQDSVNTYLNNALGSQVANARATGKKYCIGELALGDDPKATAAWPFLLRWLHDRRDVYKYVCWWIYADWLGLGSNIFGLSNGSSGGSVLMTRLTDAYASLPAPVSAQVIPSTAPVLTGGSVVTPGDGYRYHEFNSTADINVTTAGTAEVMIVDAGASGRKADYDGVGGSAAGGVFVGSLGLPTGTHNVKVAGTTAVGMAADNSAIGSLKSGVGGGAGEQVGGSGGGGYGSASAGTGANGTTGLGNKGGNGFGSTTSGGDRAGGGGGGGGAVGGNASAGLAGSGGAPRNVWNRYTVGAGSNGSRWGSTSGQGTPGSGAGASVYNTQAGNGTANTGSAGGSASGSAGSPGTGGSGKVVIRYPI